MTEPICDRDSEQTLIGWMLAKPDDWHLITDECRPEDIYTPSIRKAYVSLLQDGHQTPDELGIHCGLEPAELRTWQFNAKVDMNPDVARYKATRIAKLAIRRRLQIQLAATLADLDDPNASELEIVDTLRESVEAAVIPDSPPEDPAKPVLQFIKGVNFKYDWLIENLLERRDRMVITAHGGVGKSTLLRQLALCSAAGIHPFTGYPIPPLRVLLLDLENSDRQVARGLEGPLAKVGPFDENNLHVIAHPTVIDITTSAGWRWLSSQVAAVEPDLILGGPIYRMYEAGDVSKDMAGRDKAVKVVKSLDRLRNRFNCAIVLEAHPPKGAEQSLAPWGSMVWTSWPEFGIGLKPVEDGDPTCVYWKHWRFPRDKRDWPSTLRRGGAYGFEAR